MKYPFEEDVLHTLKKLQSATGVSFENIDLACDILAESLDFKKSPYIIGDSGVLKSSIGFCWFFFVDFVDVKEYTSKSRGVWTYKSKMHDNSEDCEISYNNFVSLYKKTS